MVDTVENIESLCKTHFSLDLEDRWKVATWKAFFSNHREMCLHPRFSSSQWFLNLFWGYWKLGSGFVQFAPLCPFPVGCLSRVGLEEFCFSQGSPAVCVAWAWVMTALSKVWTDGLTGLWLGWISLRPSEWDVSWSLHGACCLTCCTGLQKRGLLSKTNQAFLFWTLHCLGLRCSQQNPIRYSSHGV